VEGPRWRTESLGVVRRSAISLVSRLRGDWDDLEVRDPPVPEAREDVREFDIVYL